MPRRRSGATGCGWSKLAPVRDAVSLAEAVLTALGARETRLVGAGRDGAPGPRSRSCWPTADACACCIVLDNCEQVVDAAAELVEELLAALPGRHGPRHQPGAAAACRASGVTADRAAAASDERSQAVRAAWRRGPARQFSADGRSADAVAEICRRLDGLPLALELAAARLRLLTPRQIADRLDDRFRLLNTRPPHQ